MPIEDELLEKLGEYYSSEYVAKNQPWILATPFEEWASRELKKILKGDKSRELRYPISA